MVFLFLAGTFSGIFALPMKDNKNWRWENNWLVWSVVATLILPIITAFLTVPNLLDIYAQTSTTILSSIFAFGICWGIGAIFFGLGIEYLGIGLGLAIMMGLINSVGSLIPMVIQHPENFETIQGKALLWASVLFLIGIIICAWSGALRQKAQQTDTKIQKNYSRFVIGLVIAIFAGVLGPMINFAFVAGAEMQLTALKLNPNSIFSANTVWAIALPGGFLVITGYCLYLLRKNKSFKFFNHVPLRNWLIAIIPGTLWFGSIFFYGIALSNMGQSGPSVGWAIFQALAIIAGNVAGFVSGEWKGTGSRPFFINILGIIFLLSGIVLLAYFK